VAEDKGRGDEFAPEIDDLDDGDEDVLFKAQMGIYQFFATWWKHMLGALGIFLVGTLGYSLIHDHLREVQRDLHAQIDEIDRRMPAPDPLAAFGMAPMDDPEDATRMANLREGAKRYEAVASEGQGPAEVMAWLKAAEAWKRAGDTEARLRALQSAVDADASGILGWSAASQLAHAKAETGDVAGAAEILTGVSRSASGVIAEKALLDLGLIYESAERADEATRTLEDFTTRFPESPLSSQAAEALSRLKG
jgi:tetratricopeptide (TPR) repeat protein